MKNKINKIIKKITNKIPTPIKNKVALNTIVAMVKYKPS